MAQQKKLDYLSVLNVVSAFAVVMLHTNGCFWDFSTESYWATANIIESVMYFAVPVFFMISGATLIDYREKYSTKEYFKKRLSKTVIPFLAWSIIGLVYYIFDGRYALTDLTVKGVILSILNVEIISIYWFFVSLFQIYLCIPLFSAVQKERRKEVFTFLAIAGFILNSLLPFLCTLINWNYYNRVSVPVIVGYLLYPIIGYLLSHYKIGKSQRIVIYILGIAGLIMHIAGTYYLSMDAGQIIQTYKGYNNVPAIMYSTALFIFVKQLMEKVKNWKGIKLVNYISSYTFGIYLIHWFIMDRLKIVFDIDIRSIVYRVFAPFVIIIIAVLLIYLMRKIPLIRKIVP